MVPNAADASQSHHSQLNWFASGVFKSRRDRGAHWTALLVLCLCAGSALARPNISAAVPIGAGKNTLDVVSVRLCVCLNRRRLNQRFFVFYSH